MRLDGKVAVITGGASGMGKATASLFVEEGARIVIGDVQAEAAEAVADALGPACVAVRADVTSSEDVAGLVRTAVERTGASARDMTLVLVESVQRRDPETVAGSMRTAVRPGNPEERVRWSPSRSGCRSEMGTRRSGRGQRHIRQHMGARADIIMSAVLVTSRAVRLRAVSVMGASETDTRACVNS